MSDVEIEQKREEDERLDTAEDPNEEVRPEPFLTRRSQFASSRLFLAGCALLDTRSREHILTIVCRKKSPQ
jgi:hypothetical protein